MQFGLPIATHGAVIVAIVVFFRVLALGIADRLDGEEEEYEYDYEYDYTPGIFQRYDAPHQGYQRNPGRRRPARDTRSNMLTRLTNM